MTKSLEELREIFTYRPPAEEEGKEGQKTSEASVSEIIQRKRKHIASPSSTTRSSSSTTTRRTRSTTRSRVKKAHTVTPKLEDEKEKVNIKNTRTSSSSTTSVAKTYKYHPSELKYKHLNEIPNLFRKDLTILFCGFNPGIQSAITGHRYAHFTNLFWKLLIECGLFVPKLNYKSLQHIKIENDDTHTLKKEGDEEAASINFSVNAEEEQVFAKNGKGKGKSKAKDNEILKDYVDKVPKEEMAHVIRNLTFENAEQYLFDNFNIGFTDLVSRPTRNIAELTSTEMDDNVAPLLVNICTYRPQIVCFIGKDIFKRIFNYVKQKNIPKTKDAKFNFDKNFKWGRQNELSYFSLITDYFSGAIERNQNDGDVYVPIIHVFPSTSGLVGSISREFKLELFRKLKMEYELVHTKL